jgi:hypothetical protein
MEGFMKKLRCLGLPVLAAFAAALALSAGFLGCSGNSPSDPNPVNKTTLTAAISAANSAKAGVVVDTAAANVPNGAKWVTQTVQDALNAAIKTAEGVSADNAATQAQVDGAAAALNAAITVFNDAKQDGTKPDPSGTAKVIYAWVDQQEIAASAGTVTLLRGEPLTITVTGSGYSNYRWTLNGADVVGAAGAAPSYTFTSAGKGDGTYYVGLRVQQGTLWYSTKITITVQG